VTYVVPIWRRAERLGAGPDENDDPLLLTRLRLYLGDVLLGPGEKRLYDTDGSAACDEWRSGDAASGEPVAWAATFWRLRPDYERVAPWVGVPRGEPTATYANSSVSPQSKSNFRGFRGTGPAPRRSQTTLERRSLRVRFGALAVKVS